MFIPKRLPTSYGSALASAPTRDSIPADPAAALHFAEQLDREADAELAAGRFDEADRLTVAAMTTRAVRATKRRNDRADSCEQAAPIKARISLARRLDLLADLELQHGHHLAAEQLANRAAELRAGARA